MSTVRLSRKDARAIAEELGSIGALAPSASVALERLQVALAPSPRKVAAKKATAKAKRAKKATHREETSAIRADVFARADGVCELCRQVPPTDLHHAFGRVRVRQAADSCLALCRHCHREITDNRPSAERCWFLVATTFAQLGCAASARRAQGLQAKARLRLEQAGEVSRG